MTKFIGSLALAATLAAFATNASAADLKGEIVTALEHAEYSADAADLKTAHFHLYHTLNCLVGPNGQGFDKTQMNPCAGSGNGIIPDTSDAKKKAALEAAAQEARDGLATTALAAAKADAAAIAKLLKGME